MSERYRGRLKNGDIFENALNEEDGRHTGIVATTHRSIGDDEATARHLVACWNACEELGLTAKELEAGVLREMAEALQRCVSEWGIRDVFLLGPERVTLAAARDVLAKIGGTK